MSSNVECQDIRHSPRIFRSFGLGLGGGLGHPKSGFLLHQPPPPCPWSSNPARSKLYTRGAPWGSQCHTTGPLGLSPKHVGVDSAKAARGWKGLRIAVKLTKQNRQGQMEVSSFSLCPDHQSPPRTTNRQKEAKKNVKRNGNSPFDEIVNIAGQTQHRSVS